eukprot:196986_1
MSGTETQMAESININTIKPTEDEIKESIPMDNYQIEKTESVYESAMTLQFEIEPEDSELYEATNWRLTVYWLLGWFLSATWATSGKQSVSIIYIIIYIVILIVHAILILICFVQKDKNNNTFSEQLNLLLGISKKNPKNIYNLDSVSSRHTGAVFFAAYINFTLLLLIHRILYPNPGGIESVYTSDGAELLLSGFNTMIGSTIGLLLAFLVTQFYTFKDDMVIKMFQFKESQILTIKNNKIGERLNKKISQNKLGNKWLKSLSLGQRKGEYIVLFLVGSAFVAYVPESYENNYKLKGYEIDVVIYIWVMLSAAIQFSRLLLFFSTFVRYFQYPVIIMKELRKSIEGDTIEDFITWWQLRKYYIENEVRLIGKFLNACLIATIFASVVLLFIALQFSWGIDVSDIPSYVYKFVLMVLLLFANILGTAQSASTYYEEQLKHKFMLIREKLRIVTKRYDNDKNDDGDMKTKNDEQILTIIDAMIEDVKNNVFAIEIAGIRITPNIMLLIRGYVASGIIALAAAFF